MNCEWNFKYLPTVKLCLSVHTCVVARDPEEPFDGRGEDSLPQLGAGEGQDPLHRPGKTTTTTSSVADPATSTQSWIRI